MAPVNSEPLISVVICSIHPDKAHAVCDNIALTAGVECEFIVVDNRATGWSIARAYNHGASKATSPVLFFAHEDIEFEREGWAASLLEKLGEPDTGVVGFLGSQIHVNAYSTWNQSWTHLLGHVYYYEDGYRKIIHNGMKAGQLFRQAVAVDGFGMLVRRELWASHPFDEEAITGFHGYDVDFCLSLLPEYRNFVYFGAEICHYSNGVMEQDWYKATMALTEGKWSTLPVFATDDSEPFDAGKIGEKCDYAFTVKAIRRKDYPKSMAWHLVRQYVAKARNIKAYRRHLPSVVLQYLSRRVFS